MSQRLGQVARRLLRAPARLYDWHAGWLLGPRFVRLTHVGRRTGRRHRTILETIGTDREVDELLVLVGMGPTADWYRNIQKHPALELATMRRRFRPVHRVLAEREAVLALAEYERRNRWALFVIRPVLSWLAGWHYDSGDEARLRLAQQLPIVAFRPDPASPQRPI
ncbi:MAG TPA: nitroreductase family deazaflavin-dependent oxidoreductase [Streptosporangiaceae bacterium]